MYNNFTPPPKLSSLLDLSSFQRAAGVVLSPGMNTTSHQNGVSKRAVRESEDSEEPSTTTSTTPSPAPSSHWTLMVVFFSLLVDLLGFTVILPLIPSMLEYYSKNDKVRFCWLVKKAVLYHGVLPVELRYYLVAQLWRCIEAPVQCLISMERGSHVQSPLDRGSSTPCPCLLQNHERQCGQPMSFLTDDLTGLSLPLKTKRLFSLNLDKVVSEEVYTDQISSVVDWTL